MLRERLPDTMTPGSASRTPAFCRGVRQARTSGWRVSGCLTNSMPGNASRTPAYVSPAPPSKQFLLVGLLVFGLGVLEGLRAVGHVGILRAFLAGEQSLDGEDLQLGECAVVR